MKEDIVALATPSGVGAIGVIRISGSNSLQIVSSVFKGKDLTQVPSHTIHFGTIREDDGVIIDEVLASVFKAPNSYTKEDVVEISCHGSNYIIQCIIRLLLHKGARLAKPGEYTQRAFLNGRFDLAQAEAVADVIASENASMHSAAMNQMRGGFSLEISKLRDELIHFASMIELELDFGEEDVEFASRDDLKKLIFSIQSLIKRLTESFAIGNVIKNGIPTVIAGKPNAGKSTLLNALLNEEKAIVSDVPGTTRDSIEDVINVDGVAFRFIDTAGIRTTNDKVEAIGVERTHEKMKKASLIIYLIDTANDNVDEITKQIAFIEEFQTPYVLVGNKSDVGSAALTDFITQQGGLIISASQKLNLEGLKSRIKEKIALKDFTTGNTVVTNLRHYDGLIQTDLALTKVIEGIDLQVTNDFVAMDIRHALHHLGTISGTITTDDLLEVIFSKFCIGK
ncbi:MAG: tRNA modification GTPase [Marinoscillum sp.]|jgi:tRNA modification GTPase